MLCMLDTPINETLWLGFDKTSVQNDESNFYTKLLIGLQKLKWRDPQLHFEMCFKMTPYIDFGAKTELQNVPGHSVLFRKQTYGDCGFVYRFDYNQWIANKYKT